MHLSNGKTKHLFAFLVAVLLEERRRNWCTGWADCGENMNCVVFHLTIVFVVAVLISSVSFAASTE
jgi:hypothetical protein